MRRPRLGRRVIFIVLLSVAGRAFPANVLVMGNAENPLLQLWASSARNAMIVQVKSEPGGAAPGRAVLDWGRGDPPKTVAAGAALAELCRVKGVEALVAMDSKAVEAAVRDCQLPILMAGIPQHQTVSLLAQARAKALPASAVYLEANPSRNVAVIRALLPQARRIALLVPAVEPAWLPSVRAEANRLDFEPIEIGAGADLDVVRALRAHLAGLEAVLLPPDPDLINEWSLKPLLLMTVRQGTPAVGGLSARYVDAGVLAAAIADEKSLLEQIKRAVGELAQGRVPAPSYPAAVRVAVNPTVARTMGLSTEAVDRARSLYWGP